MSDYVVGRSAERDLEQIWDYIASDSVAYADRLIERFFESFELLARNPGIGHKRPDLTPRPVLFWPVGNYLIIYRSRRKRIQIVAHGARHIPRFLQDRW
jgi:plasmid stabilization system protein ParE